MIKRTLVHLLFWICLSFESEGTNKGLYKWQEGLSEVSEQLGISGYWGGSLKILLSNMWSGVAWTGKWTYHLSWTINLLISLSIHSMNRLLSSQYKVGESRSTKIIQTHFQLILCLTQSKWLEEGIVIRTSQPCKCTRRKLNYLEYPACLTICQECWTHGMVQQVETLPGKPSDPSSVSTTHTIHTPVYLYSDLAITRALHRPEYSLTASLLFPVCSVSYSQVLPSSLQASLGIEFPFYFFPIVPLPCYTLWEDRQ